MIEITKDRKGQFFFHVKGKNGQVLCHSEGYTRKENAKKAIGKLHTVLVASIVDENITDKTNGHKK